MNNPSLDAVVEKVKAGELRRLMKAVFGARGVRRSEGGDGQRSRRRWPPTRPRSPSRPSPRNSTTPCAARRKLTPLEARGSRAVHRPNAAIASPVTPASRSSKDPTDWLFTDFAYVALGVPRNPAIPANADPAEFRSRPVQAARARRDPAEGRAAAPRCAARSRCRPCATSRCGRPISTTAPSPRCAMPSPSTPPATATRSAGTRR